MSPLLISAGIELIKEVSGISQKDELTTEGKINLIKRLDDNRPFYARKTFWATVCAVVIPIINRVAGLDMQIEEVSAAITPLVAFILGESWRKKV